MKITDYIKMEELKRLIIRHLESLGLEDQVRTLNDGDLDILLAAMATLSQELGKKELFEEKMDYLVGYIIGLWAKLIIDYGAKIDEL